MLDSMDFDKTAIMVVENKMYDLFLDLEVSCTTHDKLQSREKLISSIFIAAIKLDELSIA